MNPKVSIIMPIYNGEEYLKMALDSVINQTLKEIELICINDGSTDNSLNILEEYAQKDNRIKIITQKNQGLGAARNTALKVFQGEYVMFLDCDDYFELDACEICYKTAIEQNTELVIFPAKTFSNDAPINTGMDNYARLLNLKNIFNIALPAETIQSEIYNLPMAVWFKMYHKNYFQKLNYKFPEGVIYEDVPFTLSIYLHTKLFYIISKPLYNYNYPRKNQLTSKQGWSVLDIFKVYNIFETSENIDRNKHLYLRHKNNNLFYWFTKSKWYVKIPYFLKLRREFIKLYLDGWTDKDIEQVTNIEIVHALMNFNFIKIFKQLKR